MDGAPPVNGVDPPVACVPQNATRKKIENKQTALVYDARMLRHSNDDKDGDVAHVESPERVKEAWKRLQVDKIVKKCSFVPCTLASDHDIMLCHTRAHIDMLSKLNLKRQRSRSKGVLPKSNSDRSIARSAREVFEVERSASDTHVVLAFDTFLNAYSNEAARLAVGGTINMCQKMLSGSLRNGFALVRPPGHHAESESVGGFCLFNTVAIAAKVARERFGAERVAIVDWDVHHGNGTQDMLYEDKNILFTSIHRHDKGEFYPGTGFLKECGQGVGEGFNINVPFNTSGLGDVEYLQVFDRILLPVLRSFQPDIILVSAGFDAAAGDPLGEMKVTPNGYALLTQRLQQVGSGRVGLVLEGGYNSKSVSDCVVSCMNALLGGEVDEPPSRSSASNSSRASFRATMRNVLKTQSKYWPVLNDDKLMPHSPCALSSATESNTKENVTNMYDEKSATAPSANAVAVSERPKRREEGSNRDVDALTSSLSSLSITASDVSQE